MNSYFLNPLSRTSASPRGLFAPEEYEALSRFPTQPTPLRHLPGLASEIGVSDILVKDESARLGLNAFKIIGVSYAVAHLLSQGRIPQDSVLVCATEGNHGRAVAHTARECGLAARVYMSSNAAVARVEAIEGEGAQVVRVSGRYDDAVHQCAKDAQENGWFIISDTAWPGYEEIPRLIMAGYTRILTEAEMQWTPQPPPDVVLVQAGVGGLSCAVVSWLCHRFGSARPFTIICEPASAACHLESARAGKPVNIPGPFDTAMAGLRSGEVSSLAWPAIAEAADAFLAIGDEFCAQATRVLASPLAGDPKIVSGASGACGLASLLAILQDKNLEAVRDDCGLGPGSRILIINTEGVTDPEAHERLMR